MDKVFITVYVNEAMFGTINDIQFFQFKYLVELECILLDYLNKNEIYYIIFDGNGFDCMYLEKFLIQNPWKLNKPLPKIRNIKLTFRDIMGKNDDYRFITDRVLSRNWT